MNDTELMQHARAWELAADELRHYAEAAGGPHRVTAALLTLLASKVARGYSSQTQEMGALAVATRALKSQ